MRASLLRLPKRVESDSQVEALRALLARQAEPLWPGSETTIPGISRSPGLDAELQRARASGRLVQGLEGIATRLDAEARGQELVDTRSGAPRGGRVSRLLLVANDGSLRFYRQVGALVERNHPRLLAMRIRESGEQLGELIFGPGKLARAVLVEHKESVAEILLSLAKALRVSDEPS